MKRPPAIWIIASVAWIVAIHGCIATAFLWYALAGRPQTFFVELIDWGDPASLAEFSAFAILPALPGFGCGVLFRAAKQRSLTVIAATAAVASISGGAITLSLLLIFD